VTRRPFFPAYAESFLFLFLIACELGLSAYLVAGRRMPAGHDTFQYFHIQYYFLNHAVTAGAIPLWVPLLTHGQAATWWFAYQASMPAMVLLHVPALIAHFNFLSVFHGCLFTDTLVMAVGTWLFARRFFSSPFPVFFVTVAMVGSAIWANQPWMNFRLYHMLPLALHWGHRFLETGRARYVFFAGNLLAVGSLGLVPYLIVWSSLVVFLYFFLYCLFQPEEAWPRIKNLPRQGTVWAASAGVALSLLLLYALLQRGVEDMAAYGYGRNRDFTVDLQDFLTYGGNLGLRKWFDLGLGVSPNWDYTLYAGMFTLVLAVLGCLLSFRRRMIPFPLMIAFVVLFSMGSFVSSFSYHAWPMMNHFRHIGMMGPAARLFLACLAGFGFEAVFLGGGNPGRWKRTMSVMLILAAAASMAALAFWLYRLSLDPRGAKGFVFSLVDVGLRRLEMFFTEDAVSRRLKVSAVFALGAALSLGVSAFLRGKWLYGAMGLVLVLHTADLQTYKWYQLLLKTVSLTEEQSSVTAFQPMPYARRRDLRLRDGTPRLVFLDAVRYGPPPFNYASVNFFAFKDQLGSSYRNEYWHRPWDKFLRAYGKMPLNDFSRVPGSLKYTGYAKLIFPHGHPEAVRFGGARADKVQFFGQAVFMTPDEAIAERIRAPDYRGEILYLSPESGAHAYAPYLGRLPPGRDGPPAGRFRAPYRVLRFDANHLELVADIEGRDHAWLFYSDVWHPSWKATVNGRRVPVFRASLAYKAVPLEKGRNAVRFSFDDSFTDGMRAVAALNGAFWLAAVLVQAAGLTFPLTKP
jgi:hypothetical protein